MINLKTAHEIDLMARAGSLLASVLPPLKEACEPGVKTIELDAIADRLVRAGGFPGPPAVRRPRDRQPDARGPPGAQLGGSGHPPEAEDGNDPGDRADGQRRLPRGVHEAGRLDDLHGRRLAFRLLRTYGRHH